MMFLLRRTSLIVLVAMVVAALGLIAAACSDDSSGDTGTAGIIAGIQLLDGSGLHAIDDAISKGTVPPTARTVALKAEAVTRLTKWPKDTEGDAKALADTFRDMAASLDTDRPDLKKA